MLSKIKLLSISICVTTLLASCRGEDGDPGPQGQQGDAGQNSYVKIGYFSGTVTGIRQDGTAFSEAFKYEYTPNTILAFTEEDAEGTSSISITRYSNSMADAALTLTLINENGEIQASTAGYSSSFKFMKELTPTSLFSIGARPYFSATTAFVRNISLKSNNLYKFGTYSNRSAYYSQSFYDGISSFMFYSFYKNSNYSVYYSQSTGELLAVYREGKYLTSGEDGEFYLYVD